MISVEFDSKSFAREMKMITDYAYGFVQGARSGQKVLIDQIGRTAVEILGEFIDSNARANSDALHHVYEWGQSGSPAARLFDLQYSTYGGGLTISSSFRQSSSIKKGSNVPFYDKARIMEQGIPVRIKPVRAQALRFEDDGEEVFTKKPVTVDNPGGSQVEGNFKETIDMFFNNYFSQAFLQVSGISQILNDVVTFSKNLPRAKSGGRSAGYDVGYRWIAARRFGV